jgi:hypothetical protein
MAFPCCRDVVVCCIGRTLLRSPVVTVLVQVIGTVEVAGQETLSNSGPLWRERTVVPRSAASLRLTDAVSSSVVVTSTNGIYPSGIRGTVRCRQGCAFGGGAYGTCDRLVVGTLCARLGWSSAVGGSGGLMTGARASV